MLFLKLTSNAVIRQNAELVTLRQQKEEVKFCTLWPENLQHGYPPIYWHIQCSLHCHFGEHSIDIDNDFDNELDRVIASVVDRNSQSLEISPVDPPLRGYVSLTEFLS